MTSMDISSITHMLPTHTETCPVAQACQPGPRMLAWPFQAACKCGPSSLRPPGTSMHPRHQEDRGQPSPGHFVYLVYPTSWHTLLHALTILCVSPDLMDAGQALPKSPRSCSLCDRPLSSIFAPALAPIGLGHTCAPHPPAVSPCPPTVSDGKEVGSGRTTFHRECSYKQMK